MLKDANCSCTEYCQCGIYDPCGCEGMMKDPHCLDCCQHLTPEQEERWRKENPNFPDEWVDPNE
jgi:hypothetical protein